MNFEIELQEETIEDTESLQLPMNFFTIGEIENDDVKVYIKYLSLQKCSKSRQDKPT